MNELQALHDAWDAPPAPSPAAYREARAALLARARPRRRRAPLRIVAVMTAGAIIAVFLLVAHTVGGGPPAAAEVLERAAQAAEGKPFVAPRPHQWIYTEDRITSSDGSEPVRRKIWHRVDGGGSAVLADGEVTRIDGPRISPDRTPFDSYEALTRLPRDPDALLRWAHEQAKNVEGAGMTEDGEVYAIFTGVLHANLLPPDLEAGIFRALERLPGVTVSTVDVFGQRVLSLAKTEDPLRQELFLDPETYAYRGKRATAAQAVTSIRVKTAVVDAPPD